ncbi:hypothetical protein [Paraburkholderia dipogonis]|uniref:hypothetical protein n=1 Tax=Paraburkholderia dipogonis TaxID=1211383 RepID=UPI0038B8D8E6
MSAATFRDAIAIEKSGIEGWVPFRYELIGKSDTIMTGGIPRVLTRGPNKGQRKWDGMHSQVAVTQAEVDAAMAKYEAETGICAECEGSCKVVAGWSATEGAKYRECLKCHGTGKANIQGSQSNGSE